MGPIATSRQARRMGEVTEVWQGWWIYSGHKAKKKPVSGGPGSESPGLQDSGREMGNWCLMGAEFQFHKMKRVQGMVGGGGCTTME